MSKGVKTKGHKKALLKVLDPACGICLEPILSPETATVDHIVPLSVGGTNYRNNVQLAHPKCNRRKGNDPDFLPINLRKKRCPHCYRYFVSLKNHKKAKHLVSDLAAPIPLGNLGVANPQQEGYR